jgi:hypothetical protein
MRSNYLILLAFLLFCSGVFSQSYYVKCPQPSGKVFRDEALIFALDYTPTPPAPSKQFYNTWTRGEVIFYNEKRATGVVLSYNTWLDELLWINEDSYLVGVIPKESISEFVFWDENHEASERFRKVKTTGMKYEYSYLQVLADGNYTIYCQHRLSYVPGNKDFEKSYHFFKQKEEGVLQQFKPNRRSIIQLFPKDRKAEIKSLIRKNYHWRMNIAEIAKFFSSIE